MTGDAGGNDNIVIADQGGNTRRYVLGTPPYVILSSGQRNVSVPFLDSNFKLRKLSTAPSV